MADFRQERMSGEPIILFSHSYDEDPIKLNDRSFAIHTHEIHEIFCFLSGKAEYLVEGTVYPLNPGDILIMRSGELHKIHIKQNEPYECYVLNFSDEAARRVDPSGVLLQPFYDRPLGHGNHLIPNGVRFSRIFDTFKAIDVASDHGMKEIALHTNLSAILFEIYMAAKEQGSKPPTSGTANAMCVEILSYINAHLTEPLSLNLLCDKFYISKNHLNRIFKASTGVTVWEYIKVKRLALARNTLEHGGTATEACQSSGFRDYSAFYRAYKDRYGHSPKSDDEIKI